MLLELGDRIPQRKPTAKRLNCEEAAIATTLHNQGTGKELPSTVFSETDPSPSANKGKMMHQVPWIKYLTYCCNEVPDRKITADGIGRNWSHWHPHSAAKEQ